MKILFIILFSIMVGWANGQSRKECKSSAKAKYEDSLKAHWKSYTFEPITKEEALKPIFSYVYIEYIDHPARSKDSIDSLEISIAKTVALMKIDPKDFEKEFKVRDSLSRIEAAKMIGNISKPSVIKSEKNGKQWAILYQDFKYDEMLAFGSGYWISLSEDEGKTWKKYYTGLSGGKNYYFKQNSQKPFWRDENHLQIEADIVRMTEPSIHPLSPDYEVIKDNALVILDLSEIVKDSDEDGLTDIEERNLFLNPLSKDTDGDGIPDSEDLNPRFASSSNDFTRLYEGIIFGENTESAGLSPYEDFVIHLEQPKKVTESDKNKEEFSNELGLPNTIKLIVTNDTNLQRINPKHYKIIILTPKEFEEYRKQYHSVLEQLSYSPLFQCDKNPNVYIMSSSASFSGASYTIERTKAGWKVTTLSSWIS